MALVGPTASGKSALAVRLALRFGGEVLACDSTQVYRGFDIGTAKPMAEERGGVAHHMMDLIGVDTAGCGEPFSAGDYRRRAVDVLADLRQRGRLPILTVGPGLYLRALLEGLADAPARSETLRARLGAMAARRGDALLHRILVRLDPASAQRISRNDRQKLMRAVEVCVLAGKPLTEVHRAGRTRLAGYAAVKIGLAPPRAVLYARIEQRVQSMMAAGWVQEVTAMIDAGVPAAAKPFEFIGYRELRAHVEHGTLPAEAIAAIAQATRRYAQAPAHVVSARAGRALAVRFWRRSSNRRSGGGRSGAASRRKVRRAGGPAGEGREPAH